MRSTEKSRQQSQICCENVASATKKSYESLMKQEITPRVHLTLLKPTRRAPSSSPTLQSKTYPLLTEHYKITILYIQLKLEHESGHGSTIRAQPVLLWNSLKGWIQAVDVEIAGTLVARTSCHQCFLARILADWAGLNVKPLPQALRYNQPAVFICAQHVKCAIQSTELLRKTCETLRLIQMIHCRTKGFLFNFQTSAQAGISCAVSP